MPERKVFSYKMSSLCLQYIFHLYPWPSFCYVFSMYWMVGGRKSPSVFKLASIRTKLSQVPQLSRMSEASGLGNLTRQNPDHSPDGGHHWLLGVQGLAGNPPTGQVTKLLQKSKLVKAQITNNFCQNCETSVFEALAGGFLLELAALLIAAMSAMSLSPALTWILSLNIVKQQVQHPYPSQNKLSLQVF